MVYSRDVNMDTREIMRADAVLKRRSILHRAHLSPGLLPLSRLPYMFSFLMDSRLLV